MKKGFVMIMFFAVILSIQGLQVEEIGSVDLPNGGVIREVKENGDFLVIEVNQNDDELTFIKYLTNTDLETEIDTISVIDEDSANWDLTGFYNYIKYNNCYYFYKYEYNSIDNISEMCIFAFSNQGFLGSYYDNNYFIGIGLLGPPFGVLSENNLLIPKADGIYSYNLFTHEENQIYNMPPSIYGYSFLRTEQYHILLNVEPPDEQILRLFDGSFTCIDSVAYNQSDAGWYVQELIPTNYEAIILENFYLYQGGSQTFNLSDVYLSIENDSIEFESMISFPHQTFLYDLGNGEMLYGYPYGDPFEPEHEVLVKVNIYDQMNPIEIYPLYDIHKIIHYSEDYYLLISHNHAIAGADYHTMFYKNKNNFYDGSFTEIPIGYQFFDGEHLYIYNEYMTKYTIDPLDNEEEAIEPKQIEISNFPNPFNPTTTISYALPQSGQTEITIYNLKGQKVKTLVNQEMEAGNYQVQWNGTDATAKKVSSGVYFYKLTLNGKTEAVNKCLMLK